MKLVKNHVKNQSDRIDHVGEFIVVHIMQGTMVSTLEWFNNPASNASAHYGVSKLGIVVEYVDPAKKSWACGNVTNPNNPVSKAYPGINPNQVVINIELEGFTGKEVPSVQWSTLVELIQYLTKTYGIPLNRQHILGHCEIDPVTRPYCPGTAVNLDKLVNDAQPKQEVKTVEEWKIQIVNDAFTAQIIKDCEEWMKKADDPAPVWMVLKTELNLKAIEEKLLNLKK